MTKAFCLLISLGLVSQVFMSELIKIDLNLIPSLFKEATNNFKQLKLDVPLPANILNQVTRIIPGFTDEQCALDCLKYTHCISYSFTNKKCTLTLRGNFERKITINSQQHEKVDELIKCSLKTCSSSLYCASNSGTVLKQCLTTAESNVKYELSEWSAWSTCSQACSGGFRDRAKKCLKKYLKNDSKEYDVTEAADWLCNYSGANLRDRYQIEKCNEQQCGSYSGWSEWTACNKVCGGLRNRTRDCLAEDKSSEICDPIYLQEVNDCSSLKDCQSSIISKLCFRIFSDSIIF